MFPLLWIPNSKRLKHLWYQQLYVHDGSPQHNRPVQRLSVHWRTSGSTHTAAVGAGIGRKASQPLHTAMDRNSLLHCLLLVCSLHRVTMFPKYCPPACYSLNCSWCVGGEVVLWWTIMDVELLKHQSQRCFNVLLFGIQRRGNTATGYTLQFCKSMRAVEQAGRQASWRCLPHTRSTKQHQYLSVSHREWLCCSGPRSLTQSWIWQSKCIFLIIWHWSLLWQKHLIERCGCIPSMQKGCSKW